MGSGFFGHAVGNGTVAHDGLAFIIPYQNMATWTAGECHGDCLSNGSEWFSRLAIHSTNNVSNGIYSAHSLLRAIAPYNAPILECALTEYLDPTASALPHLTFSAINRAVRTIPSNSIVAILSTSYLLESKRSRTGDTPASVDATDDPHPDSSGKKNDTNSTIDSDLVDRDVFIAYERLRTATSTLASPHVSLEKDMESPASRTGHFPDNSDGTAVGEGEGRDSEGNRRSTSQQTSARGGAGLVVFASPHSFKTADEVKRGCEDSLYDYEGMTRSGDMPIRNGEHKSVSRWEPEAATPEQEKRHEAETEAVGNSKDTSTGSGILSRARPSSEPREDNQAASTSRLRDIAPMPFIVFDTHTFFALGELDERFLFEGGVAEWLTRARLWHTPSSKNNNAGNMCASCPSISTKQSRRRFRETFAPNNKGSTLGISHTFQGAGLILTIHGRKWASMYLRRWPMSWGRGEEHQKQRDEDSTSGVSATSDVGLSSNIDAPHLTAVENDTNNGIPFEVAGVQGPQEKMSGDDGRVGIKGEHGYGRREENENPSKRREVGNMVDQWNILPPGQLEELVQTDADLFFLPWLLLQAAEGTNHVCRVIEGDRNST